MRTERRRTNRKEWKEKPTVNESVSILWFRLLAGIKVTKKNLNLKQKCLRDFSLRHRKEKTECVKQQKSWSQNKTPLRDRAIVKVKKLEIHLKSLIKLRFQHVV